MVLRLRDFDDFLDAARGCQQVFYRVEEKAKGSQVTAYAGRCWWQDILASKEALDSILNSLRDLRAKEVLEDVDLEQIFR